MNDHCVAGYCLLSPDECEETSRCVVARLRDRQYEVVPAGRLRRAKIKWLAVMLPDGSGGFAVDYYPHNEAEVLRGFGHLLSVGVYQTYFEAIEAVRSRQRSKSV